jgi:hypothetical protein
LDCIAGINATFNLASGMVSYSHDNFKGQFGTLTKFYPDDTGVYWVADVVGC